MKVQATPKFNYEPSCLKSNNLSSNNIRTATSFGSSSSKVGPLKSFATGMFKFIEKHGFFVEFLIVDTVSMIVPRILVGLNRDREKTGKWNYQAGAEEAGREILSGPSMNLIPMGMIYLISKALPASHMSRSSLEGLTNNMKKVMEKNPQAKDKDQLHKKLAEEIFDDAFGEYDLKDKTQMKSKFSALLQKAADSKSKEDFKSGLKAFEEHISLMNNQNAKEKPLNTGSIKLKKGETTAGELFEDFRDYSKDVIGKLTKTSENSVEFLEKIKKGRLNVKLASAITAFFAVGSFLLYLPKVYQRGKVSPAQQSAQRAQQEALKGGANEN